MPIKHSFGNTKNAIARIWTIFPKSPGPIGHLLACMYPYTLFVILKVANSHEATKIVSMEIPKYEEKRSLMRLKFFIRINKQSCTTD